MKPQQKHPKSDKNEREQSKGFEPPSSEMNDRRSLDIGESGQFAPGGYYNQHGKHAPEARDFEDELVPRRTR